MALHSKVVERHAGAWWPVKVTIEITIDSIVRTNQLC